MNIFEMMLDVSDHSFWFAFLIPSPCMPCTNDIYENNTTIPMLLWSFHYKSLYYFPSESSLCRQHQF